MATTALAELNALDAGEVARRLSGTPERVARFVAGAATAGSAEAQAVYGQMLLDGRGVRRDAAAAFRWFCRAAAQEHLQAINMVGRCYDLGWGVEIDQARAAEWFEAAARRGLDWGMYNYATALALGAGVPEDRAAALAWFQRAAALGNAKAINFVGGFHEDGWVVAQDRAAAAACYARAAEGGDFRGQFNYARMLAEDGAIDAALGWFARAASGSNSRFRTQAADWLARATDPRLHDAVSLFRPGAA